MKWIEVSLIMERVAVEKAATLFDDYMGNGLIEEDVDNEPDKVKLTIYGNGDLSEAEVIEDITRIIDSVQIQVSSISTSVVDDTTWYNSWQQYIKPVEILPNIVVKPSWQAYEVHGNEEIIEIDSALSFGTGAHETTRACAQLLGKYYKGMIAGDSNAEINISHNLTLLDIGTGTGILLLVAAKLGIQHLIGIDIDAEASRQAEINCETNGVQAEIICGDLDHDFHGKAEIILANLTVAPLKILLPIISKKLAKNGILIISGVINDRYEEIMPYIDEFWHIEEEVIDNSWHTFALKAK